MFHFGVEVFSCPFSVVRRKPHAEAQRARRGIFSFPLSVFRFHIAECNTRRAVFTGLGLVTGV